MTHNGFILEYEGPVFPPCRRNQITYEYFCLRGGLANRRNYKRQLPNGQFEYFDISSR